MDDTRSLGLDAKTVAEIAAEADVDVRTVWKRLAGGKVRGRAGTRVDRAIAARLARGASGATPPADGDPSDGAEPRG